MTHADFRRQHHATKGCDQFAARGFAWRLVADHPLVFEEVRGQGLLLGLKLKPPAGDFVGAARSQGLLTVPAGENVVRILPPLNVSEEQVREAVAMLDRAAATLEKRKEAAQ